MKRSFKWGSLPLFIAAHAGHHLLTSLTQPLLPYIQQEFNLDYSKSALVTSAFSISAGIAQIPSGWLADRIGPTILITLGVLGVAIGGVLVGLSSTFMMLIICFVIMGVMSAGYHPATTPLISASVPSNQLGRALGFHQIGGFISFFLTPFIAAGIAGAWGWRAPFLALAVPVAILGVFLYIYLTRRKGKSHVDEVKRRNVEESPLQPGYKRRLIAFMVMIVIGGGVAASVNPFLTLYMVNELGASKEFAAMLLPIMHSSGLWMGPVIGYLSDRIGSTRIIIITGILSGLIIFALKSVTLGLSLYAVLWVLGLIRAARSLVSEVFILSQTPAKHRSMIFGIYYSTSEYTGAIFAPIMGRLLDQYGFDVIWTYSAIGVTVVAVITSLFIWDARS
jgi:FSR family fosmidomycin resistance protein-like MFS transporter